MSEATLTREQIVQLEAIEHASTRAAYRSTPAGVAEDLGVRLEIVGGADVLIVSSADVLMFNRIAGLGVETPATEAALDASIERFRAAGVPRFFVNLCPVAQPAGLTDWLIDRGIERYNNWVKLSRSVDPTPVVQCDANIQEIGPERAPEFGRIIQRCFDIPEPLAEWIQWVVGSPNRRTFMAFDGEMPIATAAIYIEGDWAALGYAAVTPEARGRGVQSGMIAARIRAAREAGCRHICMETSEDTPEKPGYSFRNAIRMGFEVAYVRPNYLGTLARSS